MICLASDTTAAKLQPNNHQSKMKYHFTIDGSTCPNLETMQGLSPKIEPFCLNAPNIKK
jgi:hypothetical protein